MSVKRIHLYCLSVACALSVVLMPYKNLVASSSQEAFSVTGRLFTEDGAPIADATVSTQAGIQTATDADGRFSIQSPHPISGPLTFSYVNKLIGSENLPRDLPRQYDMGTVALRMGEHVLGEVEVYGVWNNKFAKKTSAHVAKMPLANLENPQTYTVIPRELLEEQVVNDFGAAMRNAPGVATGPRVDNGRHVFLLRGFQESSYMRNGLASPAYMDIDPVNLESIEVIKGPSGTLYGGSLVSFGGLVNRVTKKPLDHFTGSVSLLAGGFNLYRATADINMPLNNDSTLLARVNSAIHRQGSFQDYGYSKTFMLAPVISYRVSPRLKLVLEAEIYNREATALPGFIVSGDKSGISDATQLNPIYNRSFSTDQLNMTGGATAYHAQATYRLSDRWSSESNLSYAMNDYFRVGMRNYVLNDSLIRRTGGDVDYATEALNLQQNVQGRFSTGRLSHRVLLGLDYLQRNNRLYNNIARGTVDTVNYRTGNVPFIGRSQIVDIAQGIAKNPSNSANNTYAVYASDVVGIDEKFFVMLSLRYDYFDNTGSTKPTTGETTGQYSQGAWSPKIGLVYQALPEQISLFANFMNGFANVNGEDAEGNTFRPQQANQWEAGVKSAIVGNRVNMMLSYYDIEVSDILRTNLDNPDFRVQDGVQRSRGVEIELIANPAPGLNLIAGYGYNNSRYVKADAAIAGKRPADIPEQNANFWASYTLPFPNVRGLGFGLGGNYIGGTYYNDSNTITVPAAFILNGSVYLSKPKYRIALKGDNLTDRRYWASLNPMAPFQLTGTLQFYF